MKRLGLAGGADERIDTEVTRVDAIEAVLWSHSHVFDAEAKRDATHWRDLSSLARHGVLALAVDADPKIADRVRNDATAERDPATRDMLFGVLGGLADPVRHRAMIDALVHDPAVTPNDTVKLLRAGGEIALLDSEQYMRAHIDELLKKLQIGADDASPAWLPLLPVIFNSCDAAKRDERVAFANAHFAPLPAAARPVREAIEANDHCIAQAKLVEPSLREWLRSQ